MKDDCDKLSNDTTLTDPAQEQVQNISTRNKNKKWMVLLAAVVIALVTIGILAISIIFATGSGLFVSSESSEIYVSLEKQIENELMQEYRDRLEAEYQIILKQKEEGDPDFEGEYWMSEPRLRDIASKHVEKQFRDEIHQLVKQHGRAEYIDEFKEYHDFDSIEDYDKFFLFILDCCDLYNSDELDLVEKVKLVNYISDASTHAQQGFSNGTGNGFNKDHVAVWNHEAHQHWADAVEESLQVLKKAGKQ